MKVITRTTVALFLAITAIAEQQPAARVEFEVASVKMGDPNDPGSRIRQDPNRLEMFNVTLKNLIMNAYGVNPYQVEDGPKWMDSARFTIDAKLPAGGTREQVPLMLRSLLADRFKLEVHLVTKTRPVYQLVVAKGGPKLQMPTEADRARLGAASSGDRQIKGWGVPVSSLAGMLVGVVAAPVIDRTGLDGKYNFSLEFAPFLGTPKEDETLPTIFAALQETLGLKLEAIKGPVEVVVIDRADKPVEN